MIQLIVSVDWPGETLVTRIHGDGGETVAYDHRQGTVQPLTRRGADGEPYRRTPEVERQIASVLDLDADQLIVRARISSQTAPHYLREECIVYFIRDHHRRGHAATVAALFDILLRRCEGLFRNRLGSLDWRSFEEAHSDCVGELVGLILDLTTDRGDFLQVRFWTALNRLAISTFNRYKDLQHRAAYAVTMGTQQQDDDNSSPDAVDPPDPGLSVEQLAEYRDGLSGIREPYRTAFVLRYYHGWPVEDDDPTTLTISRLFHKTPRMIRNYLSRAEQALVQWRGESS